MRSIFGRSSHAPAAHDEAGNETMDVVNQLTDAYATAHNVQNPPLE
jgi:hypothetical protein